MSKSMTLKAYHLLIHPSIHRSDSSETLDPSFISFDIFKSRWRFISGGLVTHRQCLSRALDFTKSITAKVWMRVKLIVLSSGSHLTCHCSVIFEFPWNLYSLLSFLLLLNWIIENHVNLMSVIERHWKDKQTKNLFDLKNHKKTMSRGCWKRWQPVEDFETLFRIRN